MLLFGEHFDEKEREMNSILPVGRRCPRPKGWRGLGKGSLFMATERRQYMVTQGGMRGYSRGELSLLDTSASPESRREGLS